jgi:hypothetical protein
MTHRLFAPLASLTLATALAAPLAQAQTLSASGGCGKVVGGGLPFDPSFNPACPGGTWLDDRPGTSNTAGWTAKAGFGAYAVTAFSSLSNLPPLGTTTPLAFGVSGSGFARSVDTLTLDAPGLGGQRGRIAGSVLVDGALVAQVSGPTALALGTWELNNQVIQNNQVRADATTSGEFRNQGGVISGASFVDRLLEFNAEVVFGSPFILQVALRSSASATVRPEGQPGSPTYLLPVSATAGANFGNSAYWNGLQGVTLLNGTPVSGWSVSSLSGTNYAQPIPEPATAALWLLGLAAVLALQRRSSR